MLPEDLARLLSFHDRAASTGSGLNPRLLEMLEARAEAHRKGPAPDAALPGDGRVSGPPMRPCPTTVAEAIASGKVLAFPTPAMAKLRARA
ncbi:hypothetical protein ACQ5SO_20700 [Rhodovulum sp. DZ06]|uniref:hypothetical protein n=1 Tax=Rhodovulum sp. DZ06 TaxID=3425126 RepID=UPI003D32CC28